jgi:Ca-activated chloride channel family protein
MRTAPRPTAWSGWLALLLALWLTSLLGACGDKKTSASTQAPSAASAQTFTILAGSELKDLVPLLPGIEQATGLQLKLNYVGTLEGVERLGSGDPADAAWFASNRYALLTPGVKERVLQSERTMITPVVLGMKQSKARSLGWLAADGSSRADLSWKDIALAAEQGRFSFAMSSPSASNTGFAALMGLAAALAGKGDALEVADIRAPQLRAFFKAQTLTAGSSGWLAEAFVKEQGRIDGLINYGSVIHGLNASGQLSEPLVLIYPQDGIVSADYPLMLINPTRRADYDKLLAYVRSPAFQQAMTAQTHRKPINPEVAFEPKLYPNNLVELPFPARLQVVDAILEAYDNSLRRPADSTFVLDISGSMAGERIAQLKTALAGLTGLDSSLSGRYSRLREREQLSMVAFDDQVSPAVQFQFAPTQRAAVEAQVRSYIANLQAQGGTAIYSAAQAAYQQAAARRAQEGGRDGGHYYSLVLLTDGQNNNGLNAAQFTQWYQSLPPAEQGIRIFAVQFGEASPDELEALARLTGGRVFNATRTPLAQVFKEIRGYQ